MISEGSYETEDKSKDWIFINSNSNNISEYVFTVVLIK